MYIFFFHFLGLCLDHVNFLWKSKTKVQLKKHPLLIAMVKQQLAHQLATVLCLNSRRNLCNSYKGNSEKNNIYIYFVNNKVRDIQVFSHCNSLVSVSKCWSYPSAICEWGEKQHLIGRSTNRSFRRYCTPNQKLAYFVRYLKIINTFLENITCIL